MKENIKRIVVAYNTISIVYKNGNIKTMKNHNNESRNYIRYCRNSTTINNGNEHIYLYEN